MMNLRYNTIKLNDIANSPGISVSVYLQGCPKNPHCKGCHNPETWDFNGGKEFTYETLSSILHGLIANGFFRNLEILGGEPLCEENLYLVKGIISTIRVFIPQTLIYIWTGYLYEDLLKSNNEDLKFILNNADVLVDGPYIEEQRTLTTPMKGSLNQRIISLREGKIIG